MNGASEPGGGLDRSPHLFSLEALAGPIPALIAGWLAGLVLVAALEPPLILLNVIGFVGGLISGLVGIGGAIILTPLLLYMPPLFRLAPIGMQTVTGITMVQVAVAGAFAVLAHQRDGHIDGRLMKSLGAAVIVGSFVGAALSGYVSGELLQGVFASLALVTVILIPLRLRGREESVEVASRVPMGVAVLIGLPLGLLAGLIGAGGGFLLVPLMLYVLGVSPRTAMGTSLAIVALSSLAGMVGKTIAGHVDVLLALALVVGGVPGAQAGAAMSSRLSSRRLLLLFVLFIGAAALTMWWELLQ